MAHNRLSRAVPPGSLAAAESSRFPLIANEVNEVVPTLSEWRSKALQADQGASQSHLWQVERAKPHGMRGASAGVEFVVAENSPQWTSAASIQSHSESGGFLFIFVKFVEH